MPAERLVLGIESSCDETAAAIATSERHILASVIMSQWEHADYGGVVPELASRAHIRNVLPVVNATLDEAGLTLSDLSGIAVTCGPGLIGSLLVGVNVAKGLAFGRDLPLIGVHHLEGHLFSALISNDLQPPFIALLVSGGHTELIHVHRLGEYELLGTTLDDAAGEAFDKVAKLLDLLPAGQVIMGGRAVADAAQQGDPHAIAFPRALAGRATLDVSFSGLKTAVLTHVRGIRDREGDEGLAVARADIAASFQQAVVDVLVERTARAVDECGVSAVALVGGVAANRLLRQQLAATLADLDVSLAVPAFELCTDNAAMIAAVGAYRLGAGQSDGYDLDAHPRLPLPGLRN